MAKKETVICKHCYAYSMWSGEFRLYEGEVVKVPSSDPKYEDFFLFSSSDNEKLLNVSIKEQAVYNGIVWMPERNDDLAKNLFIEYEERQIAVLQKRINNHRNKIEVIKSF